MKRQLKLKYLFIILFVFVLGSCREDKIDNKNTVDFYYLRPNINFSPIESKYLNRLETQNLYLKLFDVDFQSDQIQAINKLQTFHKTKYNLNFVPVINLNNKIFADIPLYEVDLLAKSTFDNMQLILKACKLEDVTEVQFDCDWTPGIQKNYFRFLEKFKEISKKKTSCILRMAHVKSSEKLGVPPVNKAYLICYSNSDSENDKNLGTLLNLDVLKEYLANVDSYPLKLDIVIPLSSVAIVTNNIRQNKIITGVSRLEFEASDFKMIEEPNLYQFKIDTYFHSIYMNRGFRVKLENMTPDLLSQTREYLSEKLKRPYHLVYYTMDDTYIDFFNLNELRLKGQKVPE